MSAADQIHVVLLQEAGDDVRAEGEGHAAVVLAPAGDVFVRVGPQQIAQQAAVRDLQSISTLSLSLCRALQKYVCWPHHTPDLLHRVEIWAQSTVHREDLLINDRRNWQAVEAVRERLPQLDVVASLTLIVEPVDTVDGGALVVPAQDEKVFWVLDLVRKKQADGFE